ncbi:hypothetical protein CEQ90_08655 [Lewinellaceae bacterium SD302]|nr:hypothetical protein CEQ90_08655 [Lewinellaceae bacterium SD302]
MKNRIIYLLVSLWLTSFSPFLLVAQHHDNIWLMSTPNGGVEVNFSSGEPEVFAIDIPLIFMHSSITMSNDEGEMIFYTNSCRIHDSSFSLMQNGNGLNPGNIYDQYCNAASADTWGYPQIGQGVISLPVPYAKNDYYVVHKPIDNFYDDEGGLVGIWSFELLYSRIIMNENVGYGAVVDKNVVIDIDTLATGNLAANKHANGEDWWVLLPTKYTNEINIYYVDSAGIGQFDSQFIGLAEGNSIGGAGQSIFSPDGKLYLRYNSIQGLSIFDFDRQTGILSNFRNYPIPIEEEIGWPDGGVGMSPNSRYVYVSDVLNIYQYDLEAQNVAASRVHIAEMHNDDNFVIHPNAYNFQLGPDCKLYVFNNSGISHHVIHSPNNPGQSCDFEQGALEMPYPVFRDQPYFPHYRLGPLGDEGSPCAEPLVSNVEPVEPVATDAVTLSPNPTYGPLRVEAKNGGIVSIRVIDGFGRVVQTRSWPNSASPQRNIDLSTLHAGVYNCEVTTKNGEVSVERIIIQ